VTFKATDHELRLLLIDELAKFEEDEDDKSIEIVGADRLRPTEQEREDFKLLKSDNQLSDEKDTKLKYGDQFNSMLKANKVFRRYIYLPSPPEIKYRTKIYQNGFLKWLKEQEVFLTQNKEYRIITTPRAPMYGAPKSILFFRNMLVEVFFKEGGGGFIVTSRGSQRGGEKSVVESTREALIEGYLMAADGPEPVTYTSRTVGKFTEYRNKVQQEVES
jgi:hypothetical protein